MGRWSSTTSWLPRAPNPSDRIVPGIDSGGIHGVQTLDDGAALIDRLANDDPKRAVIIGGGYIGIEMAEAMVHRGLDVTVID